MNHRNLFNLTTLATLALGTSTQAASLIYSSTFTAADDTSLLGFAPETNNGVAGATYHESDNFWTESSAVGVFGNRAQLGADNQASLPIGSSGAFTQPEIIRVSALMNLGNTAGPSTPSTTGEQRGVGLGFFAGTSALATLDDFRGLVITTDGRLIFSQHGVAGAQRAGYLDQVATGLDINLDHNVSFDVNTVSGDISNIILNGDLQTDIATTLFSGNVSEVGFFASSAGGGTLATFDDFTVTGIPEPSSLAILGLGCLLVTSRRRR